MSDSTQKQRRKTLLDLYREREVLDLATLRQCLAGRSVRSIYRDLKALRSLTSYSHAGKYSTLRSIAKFDRRGLWQHEDIRFARYGTLRNTIIQLVRNSEAGYTHKELRELLHVRVDNTVLELVQARQIGRENVHGMFLYVSGQEQKARTQLREREQLRRDSQAPVSGVLIIEILAEVIRSSQVCVDVEEVRLRLGRRGVSVTQEQVAQVLELFKVKKIAALK